MMKVLHLCSQSVLIVAVEQCHQQIHEEKHTEQEIDHEKHRKYSAVLICGEHDVWAVRGRQEHKHVEARWNVVREVHDTLHWAPEDTETQKSEKENIEHDEHDHWKWIFENEKEAQPSASDRSHIDKQQKYAEESCTPSEWVDIG